MKIFLFEYASSGGIGVTKEASSMVVEGFSMMISIAHDMRKLGHEVVASLSTSLDFLRPWIPVDKIVDVTPREDLGGLVKREAELSDASLIIAPETGGILGDFVTLAESRCASLNGEARLLRKWNKIIQKQRFHAKRIPSPDAIVSTVEGVEKVLNFAENVGFPLVFKPVDGVGCSGLSIARSLKDLSPVLDLVREASTQNRFLVEPLVEGVHASVSLVSDGRRAAPLTLNRQLVSIGRGGARSCYFGGEVPWDSDMKERTFAVSKKAVECFPGLRGFIGVDMVLTERGPTVLEVNPRLTVSYVGVRKTGSENVGRMILEAILNSELPDGLETNGYCAFRKVRAKHRKGPEEYLGRPEVVCPPLLLSSQGWLGLIATNGRTPRDTRQKLVRIARATQEA